MLVGLVTCRGYRAPGRRRGCGCGADAEGPAPPRGGAGPSTITRTGEVVGSVDYLAPERVRGQDPGPASD
ncbi:hypothetical protein ABZ584_24930, partial [Streptomyces antibioticus]|uniref:hypothetical protein n=1 Tax=Streptomyces antibioticus TaxID=1890 RepID=UPI00340870E7